MATLSTNALSQEELNLLRVLVDPVIWARLEIGWEARWYQAKILHSRARKIVIRAGRRTGKTDSLCVITLHHGYTQPNKSEEGYRILYVAPYESQVDEFFLRLDELIERSNNLKASVIQNIKSPHRTIKFANNTIIRGMSAGSKSGKGAANIRGQKADLLILDEAAYLTAADVNTLLALQLQNPKTIKIIAASTPAGGDNHFRRWCVNKELGWQEFHYPAWVNPNWSPEMEAELREEFPGTAYDLEVAAEFATESSIVFPRHFVEAAIERGRDLDLAYGDFKEKRGPRVLGVDWDKYGSSTNMVVVEFDQTLGLYKPIERVEIPRSKFTLDEAVRKIISLNETHELDYIYVDRGYGEYQVEMLHRFGLEHPETGLHEKVIGVTFSDTIKVPDPFTKELVKKRLKHWIVNQLQLLFERSRIVLSPKDRVMARQFFNYSIRGYSGNGEPIYTDQDEHIIDAIGLAVHGFLMHFSDICKIKVDYGIAKVTNLFAKADTKSAKTFGGPRRRPKMATVSRGYTTRRSFSPGMRRTQF